jgi:hypothetical protein
VSTTARTSSFVPIWPIGPNGRSLITVVTALSFPGPVQRQHRHATIKLAGHGDWFPPFSIR